MTALGQKLLTNYHGYKSVVDHPDFRDDAKWVAEFLLNHSEYYCWFYFRGGDWGPAYVQISSVGSPSKPQFVIDGNNKLDGNGPYSGGNDYFYACDDNADKEDFLEQFSKSNAEVVFEQALGKWTKRESTSIDSSIGSELNLEAGFASTGSADVLGKSANVAFPIDRTGMGYQNQPFDQSLVCVGIIPKHSQVLYVPLSYPGVFKLNASELLKDIPQELPEAGLWAKFENEPSGPVFLRVPYSAKELEIALLAIFHGFKEPKNISSKSSFLKSIFRGTTQRDIPNTISEMKLIEKLRSGEYFESLEQNNQRLALVPLSGRVFCVPKAKETNTNS